MEDLTNREIRLFLLDLLNDIREKTFIDEKVKIPAKKYEKVIDFPEALEFFFKFQLEDGIIKNIHNGVQDGEDFSIIEFTEYFDDYIKKELGSQVGIYLKKFDKENIYNDTNSKTEDQDIRNILYNITYSPLTEIIINDIVVLKKLQTGTANAVVFEYLIKNPNKEITLKEIREKNNDINPGLNFHKIVNSLGFKSDLKKIFFPGLSNKSITFKNPIYKEYFETLSLSKLRLRVQGFKDMD